LKALQGKQGVDVVTAAFTSFRSALQKPETVYDPWQASARVEALVRAARSSAHYRAFSHDVTEAILVYQNNETAAMLVYQQNPVGIENFFHVKTFFCSKKFA